MFFRVEERSWGCGFISALLFVLFFALVFFSLSGCSTMSELECPPPPECPVIEEETFACPEPRQLPELILPSFPPKPLELLLVNSWAADVAEIAIAREKIMLDRIEVLEQILDEYRRPPE